MQIRDVVIERQVDEQRRQLANRQQELRILASFIAAAGMAGSEQLVKQAGEITLLRPPDGPDGRPQLKPVPLTWLARALSGGGPG